MTGERGRPGGPASAGATAAVVACLFLGLLAGRVPPSRVSASGVSTHGVSVQSALVDSSCDTSWTMYQHDADHSGQGCSTLGPTTAATLHPAWFTATPGAVTAEPTVANGTVYVGDSSGDFHALDAAGGASVWSFDITTLVSCYLDHTGPYADQHGGGFGSITSSAAFAGTVHADSKRSDPTVFFGGGATLFALDAKTGACDWAQDLDPGVPTSAVEIESSPVVDTAVSPPEVIVGSDDNSGPGHQVTGLYAFDAVTGALIWRYEPERDVTLYPRDFGGNDALTLSCGDGSANPDCNPIHVPGIAANSTATADACGDVWSSPTLDPGFVDPAGKNTYEGNDTYGDSQSPPLTDPVWQAKRITASGRASRDGLAVFGTGNCAAEEASYANHDYAHAEGVFAVDPVTGVRVWNWFEPANLYNSEAPDEPGAGDDDFGGSAVLATVPGNDFSGTDPCPVASGYSRLAIEGSKSGYAYGLCEATGQEVWGVQAAQPGQLSPDLVGAVGGFIGSPSVGTSNGEPAAFFDAAIFLPFADDGVREPGDGDGSAPVCQGLLGLSLPSLPACPDPSIVNDPTRLMSVQALDAATGTILWRGPASPSYAATTYSNGVVFAASTTQFSDVAYDADNGLPLWHFPLGAAAASGTAIAGPDVFVGSGLAEGSAGPTTVPPGNNGVWCFTTAASVPGSSALPST